MMNYEIFKEVVKEKFRGVDEVKQEAAHKEVSKVREDKAR